MLKLGLLTVIATLLLALPALADDTDTATRETDLSASACSLGERVAACTGQLEDLRRGYAENDNFHGAIRFRTQMGSLDRWNDLSHRVDFDLYYSERIADNVRLNLQFGSDRLTDSLDVIRERHGDPEFRLKNAFVTAHIGE